MATDPVGPFPLHAYWERIPFGGYETCYPPNPPGAKDETYVSQVATVPANGFDPGVSRRDGTRIVFGSRRGEELPCGEISCGHAEVVVPSVERVVRVVRFASEALAAPIWHIDPYATIGWCDFAGVKWDTTPANDVRITVTLKNWSENRARLLFVRVWVAA